jgi:hypothetical protein
MGEDVLLYWVRQPSVPQDVALQRVGPFVAAWDSVALERLCECTGLGYECALFDTDDARDACRRHAIEVALLAAVGVLYEQHRRDVVHFLDSAGADWLFTGGLSWGDAPTDAAEPFYLLDMSGFDVVLLEDDWVAG